jgi:hypothetical protein
MDDIEEAAALHQLSSPGGLAAGHPLAHRRAAYRFLPERLSVLRARRCHVRRTIGFIGFDSLFLGEMAVR